MQGRGKFCALAACGLACSTFTVTRGAEAQTAQWERDTSGVAGFPAGAVGCAVAIAVGPNDQPIVLGCGSPDGNGDRSIWYRSFIQSSAGGFGYYQWVQLPGAASYVAVDTAGAYWVANSEGHLYTWQVPIAAPTFAFWQDFTINQPSPPSANVTAPQVPSLPASGIGGCVTAPEIINEFVIRSPQPAEIGEWNIWATGCGAGTDREIWNYNTEGSNFDQWFDPQNGQAAANQLALFGTGNDGFSVWSLAFDEGYGSPSTLWQYNAAINAFDSMPNVDSDRSAFSLTDHYALGANGVSAWDDSTQSWTPNYASLWVENDGSWVPMSRIAYASANPGFGAGSPLWGVDAWGGIWYAVVPEPIF